MRRPRKFAFVAVLLLGLGFAAHALAAESGFTALAPIPGLTDTSATSLVNSDLLANFFNNLYKYLIGVAAILAIIEIMWGGVEISTQDSVSKKSDGKQRIYNALWGLLLVLSPAIVFTIINPSILNLSIGLKPLDISTSKSQDYVGIPGANKPRPVNRGECTESGALFKQAACPSEAARTRWIANCTTGAARIQPAGSGNGVFRATCDTTSGLLTGPFVFLDMNDNFSGKLQRPLVQTPDNPSNGSMVENFSYNCRADLGVTCLRVQQVVDCKGMTSNLATTSTPVRCFTAKIECRDPEIASRSGCSNETVFSPIP